MKRENMRTRRAKERLEAHRDMVKDLEALQTEFAYARKYMGKIAGTAYTGMPKGSPTPGRSRPEEEYIGLESIESRIREKESRICEDWEELEALLLQIKPMQALILKVRYHYGAEWGDICSELYGKKADYGTEYERYKNRMFGIHNRALQELDLLLKNQGQNDKKVSETK